MSPLPLWIGEVLRQLVNGSLAGGKAVDPVQVGKADAQAAAGVGVLDAKRDDDFLTLARDGHLAANVFALVAEIREHQQHRPAVFDRVNDFVVERAAGAHVARRNPAGDAAAFKFTNDLHRRRAILGDVADEEKEIAISVGHHNRYLTHRLREPQSEYS